MMSIICTADFSFLTLWHKQSFFYQQFIYKLLYFNRKYSNWWKNDIATGNKINCLTAIYGLSQIINEPKNILLNSYACSSFNITSG